MNGPVLGVLGGMGPLASAEFVRTIYETAASRLEQEAPRVLLYSDPGFPDRTEAAVSGRDTALLARLIDALRWFEARQVSSIVICCVTIHYLLPRVPAALRARVIPLTDIILNEVARQRRHCLLMCTTGTRTSGVFERHPLWASATPWIVQPDAGDQAAVHDLIYCLKRDAPIAETRPLLERLRRTSGLEAYIAGCTELHMLDKRIRQLSGISAWDCIDPLATIAHALARPRQEATP